jgi:type VI secretion system secreted protein VgrG
VTSPLGDKLLLRSMTGHEALGRPFQYDLELLSETDDVRPSALLGKLMTVHVELPSGELRHFQGHVTRLARVGREGRFVVHRATLRPWLWLLTRTVDCRIFQNLSVPEVIKKVFRDFGFSHFEEDLFREYRAREYIVQYRESSFDFLSRLMEDQGIYYYFKHDAESHTLVLADDPVSHSPMPGYAEIPYYPPHLRDEEHFDHWSSSVEVQSGDYSVDDYNFKAPNATLVAQRVAPQKHDHADLPRYEYPAGFTEATDGAALARVRLEEQQVEYERFEGDADCRGLSAGYTFTLTEYPRDDQNKKYLVIAANYKISAEHFASASGAAESYDFRCSVIAIDGQVAFRPARITAPPRMSGPQTATVVGKAGEEIWTDEFGRVRLQFHWDREGDADEKSSCWVRVGQLWAGAGFGAQYIPRIGHEVIVDFLGGDPDRPIVVGSVYNGFNQPPFTLPENQTQSGIKTRSSRDGNSGMANEIRFEDKKGSEQLYIQAQRDKDVVVKANRSAQIGASDKLEIKGDRIEKIGEGVKSNIRASREVTIGASDYITIADSRFIKIGDLDSTSIAGNRLTTIGRKDTETITGDGVRAVGGNVTESIGGSKTETIEGVLTQSVTGGVSINTPAAVTINAMGGLKVLAPSEDEMLSSKTTFTGLKTDIVTIAATTVANVKTDLVTIKVAEHNMNIKLARTEIKRGELALGNFKLVIMG